MKTHRIVITNVSGGEGKTTLARELAYALAGRGFRVGLLDLDPQASLSKSLGLHDEEDSPGWQPQSTVVGVFQQDHAPPLPLPIPVRGVDVWPANDGLSQAEAILSADFARVANLREALDELTSRETYDFLILDTKPQRTNFLAASVAAADHIVVPVSGIKGLENLDMLYKLVKMVRGHAPEIGVRLFVPNRIRAQVNHHKKILGHMEEELSTLATVAPPIRDSLSVMGGAAEVREAVIQYRPGSDIAQDFQAVTDTLLDILGVSRPAPVAP
ncbi:ParA family protein [Deinococcus aerius]|uniref:ParA family protein n=1 Tax=Deinococcus aerius TaxID=200253 RepID=A0A2I9D0I1_9DEIO|nr:ParA family protein [Deinococcus aerius]GBF08039.1 ParA family protein [Deinococcus aerius]